MSINRFFYLIKPFIPRSLQIFLRRYLIKIKMNKYRNVWPIRYGSEKKPDYWHGWPNQKKFALVLTHDVESHIGQKKCENLMKLEKKLGFKSSFNFVPERYNVSDDLMNKLGKNGFEVGVHGLNHDGKLYQSWTVFKERATKINYYLKKWNAVGFRAPAMHHNLDWLHELDIEYDLSTFDTDPFEPQSDGIDTIFPLKITKNNNNSYIEMPYTLPQDFTLFILMQEKTIDIWKKKLDWIAENEGLALINVHPDYINFNPEISIKYEFPSNYYEDFLRYIKTTYENQYWHILPRELCRYWQNIPVI